MAITIIRNAPEESSFTPLADFQSQTPESLADPEVLHYSSAADLSFTPSTASAFTDAKVHVYVTSKLFIIWSEADGKGLTIPYQNISLHAAQAAGTRGENSRGRIYMQLEGASHLTSESASNGNAHESPEAEDDEMSELVEIHVTPEDESTLSAFYDALCACATLNPDPRTEEDEMFGEDHEWITADNFQDAGDEFGDEDTEGNVAKWRRTE